MRLDCITEAFTKKKGQTLGKVQTGREGVKPNSQPLLIVQHITYNQQLCVPKLKGEGGTKRGLDFFPS